MAETICAMLASTMVVMRSPTSPLIASALLAVGCARTEPAAPDVAPPTPTASTPESHHSAPPAHHGAEHHDHADTHGPIGHRFERAEDWTAVFDDPARDAWQVPDQVVRAMQIQPGATVADLGAGTGYFLPHLSRAVGPKGTVIAIDIEHDMVRHMRERAQREGLANVRVVQGTPASPALSVGSVDRVLIVNTWHHIPDREAYARKLREALREGGTVVVVDYTLDSPDGPPLEHRLPPEHVERELRSGGLVASRIQAPLPRQYIVIGRR